MGVFFYGETAGKSIYGRAMILYTVHNKNLEEIIMKENRSVTSQQPRPIFQYCTIYLQKVQEAVPNNYNFMNIINLGW